MELRQLHTFRTVAQSLSFTRAADTLNYAQSSVSAQIQELESEFGVPLFERLGRKVLLTQAGERLLHYSEKILDLTAEARKAVASDNEPAGTLTITAPESLCTYRLPHVLDKFRRRYPRVALVFRPLPLDEDLERQFREGTADMALVISEPRRSPNIVFEPLLKEAIYVVANAEHRLARRAQIDVCEFHQETMLLTEAGCSYRVLFDDLLRKAGARPATVLEFHSVEAIKQCTLAGLGIAVLPEMAVHNELAEGKLVALAFPDHRLEMSTYLAWHKDKWLSPALQAFVNVTLEELRPSGVEIVKQ